MNGSCLQFFFKFKIIFVKLSFKQPYAICSIILLYFRVKDVRIQFVVPFSGALKIIYSWHFHLQADSFQQIFFNINSLVQVLPYWGDPNDRKSLRKYWNQRSAYSTDSEESAPFHVLITSYQLVIMSVYSLSFMSSSS